MASKRLKQAVVVIHGMGEQVPMDTIRSFVEMVVTEVEEEQEPQQWFKPENFSSIVDQRRIRISSSRKRPSTEFMEFYWAHQAKNNSMSHLFAWFLKLLFSPPTNFGPRIIAIWFTAWLSLIGFLVGMYYGLIDYQKISSITEIDPERLALTLSFFVIYSMIQFFLIKYLGDAARYLHGSPENVEMRNKILGQGIQFFKKLHDSGEYDRIIVVAHSLGSVIAYDILQNLWGDYYRSHNHPEKIDQEALEALVNASSKVQANPSPENIKHYQQCQQKLWQEQQKYGNRWLISDFITMGSPLAHAPALMANGRQDLRLRQSFRLYPTSPPFAQEGKDFYYHRTYNLPNQEGVKRSIKTLDVGALFAVVRWTNMYFPGDFIGGPLQKVFGPGIKDIKVFTNPQGWKSALPEKLQSWTSYIPGAPHIWYWNTRPFHRRNEKLKEWSAQKQIIRALRLNSRRTLKELEDLE